MDETFWIGLFVEQQAGRTLPRAMPIMLGVLCILVIAYRYYSAFLAARVAVLDSSRPTPAHTMYDGQNYHPTNRWVLFGHHFAAISGAGPLIGPVLAMQFGYMPGLLWLLAGVCLAGAVQDMLVLASSVRRKGMSLAEIARAELGPWATVIVSAAILFIVIIALAGLGIVVVKALGGEQVRLPAGTQIRLPSDQVPTKISAPGAGEVSVFQFPPNCQIRYPEIDEFVARPESFLVRWSANHPLVFDGGGPLVTLPEGCAQLVKGSSWGTFTIACTIPIALFVGLYMYRIRKGAVVEASLIGALGVIGATIIGNWIPGSRLEQFFALSREETIVAMVVYGFVASVLPVWLLLCPRDYLSSFLKIGTLVLLVVGVLIANPTLKAPRINEVFASGGPTFKGAIFPFVFICIMCGAISGFHSLVSSGTTPKMIDNERDVRPIGYGAMLIEGLVGVVALIAAASMDPKLYFEMNTDLAEVSKYQRQLEQLYDQQSTTARDPMHALAARDIHQLRVDQRDLGQIEQLVGGESLRGRVGGAVTLAVGMALILTDAVAWTGVAIEGIMKYWYHFAIMFEALFILTTIDTGTRIARFLVQEAAGKINPRFAKTNWLPSAVLSTLLVTLGWGALIWTGSISTIWPMFGIANQLLAVVALCLVTTVLINGGRARYAWVTLLPMLFVLTTTMTAGTQMVSNYSAAMVAGGHGAVAAGLNLVLTMAVMTSVILLLVIAVSHWSLKLFPRATGRAPRPSR